MNIKMLDAVSLDIDKQDESAEVKYVENLMQNNEKPTITSHHTISPIRKWGSLDNKNIPFRIWLPF